MSETCSQTYVFINLRSQRFYMNSHTPTLRLILVTLVLVCTVPPYYGQFALSMGKENPYIFSKFNHLNSDTTSIQTLSMVPWCSYRVLK